MEQRINVLIKQALKQVPFKWVIKIVGENIMHATEIGAVVKNIRNKKQAKDALLKLIKLAEGLGAKKILIQQQLPIDYELFAGLKNIEGIHILLLGWGGIYTEVIKDIQSVVLPADKDEICETLNNTKIVKLLKGARGGLKVDIEKICDVYQRIALIPQILPCYKEADFNPLIVNRSGVHAVDFKIMR